MPTRRIIRAKEALVLNASIASAPLASAANEFATVGEDSVYLPVLAAVLAASFLCGSVPFALLLGRLRGIDIRTVGSGNVGATNLGRALGKPWGIACFALDALKGAAPVVAFGLWRGCWGVPIGEAAGNPTAEWVAVAAAAILGHVFSPWVGFRGGKGVATGFGAMAAMWPLLTWPMLGALLAWAILLLVSRFISLASVAASLVPPAVILVQAAGTDRIPPAATPLLIATTAIAVLVVFRHRGNLARLRAGTEPRIGGGRGETR
jgi:glycerol-3-phosphate acyltransferase PlsY